MTTKSSRSGHLPINGLSLYHEVYGELDGSPSPLRLMPGAFMATDSMRSWASAFVRDRTVIVFDQQGHGRTPDTPSSGQGRSGSRDERRPTRPSSIPPSARIRRVLTSL
jgi:pimeloyl-ACP methyl ester carboxylesterase